MALELEIRTATPQDALNIAQTHVKSWREAYQGIIHQSYLDDGLNVAERAESWAKNLAGERKGTFLAFYGEALAGFITVGQSRNDQYLEYAELYAIYLDPEFFGLGIGKSLLTHAVEHLIAQEFEKMFVNVLSDNKLGRQFYDRMGALPIEHSEENLVIDGQTYKEMKYEWPKLIL
jgi:ribosomal protein S18 acetylase RimI-like enzyme